MTAGIIISVLVVVCFIAVRSYVKKLAHGCCGGGGDKEQKLTKTTDLSEFRFRVISAATTATRLVVVVFPSVCTFTVIVTEIQL